MESPFNDFVSSIFESRSEAKKSGNEALSYVYKCLMNKLYGRFGIHPKSTITEICDEAQYKDSSLMSWYSAICLARTTTAFPTVAGSDYWKPPKNSAVQISAAISAYARIYMYPTISREDCYYTDTDSVFLSEPLPNEMVYSSILGKFKLEQKAMEGAFSPSMIF